MNKHYNTLGLNADCTFEQVKTRYKQLAKATHPDNRTTGNAESFKKVKLAYDKIKDFPSRFIKEDFTNDNIDTEPEDIIKFYMLFMDKLYNEKAMLDRVPKERIFDIAQEALNSYLGQQFYFKIIATNFPLDKYYKSVLTTIIAEFDFNFRPHCHDLRFEVVEGEIMARGSINQKIADKMMVEWIDDLENRFGVGYERHLN